jgi:glycerol-1-phosphate dehydrogenase [NAD(P)+]
MDIIAELLAGRLRDPDTGEPLHVPVKSVVIERSLKGAEAELVRALGLPPPHAVLTDQNTYEVLGRRVEEALGRVIPIRLSGRPIPDDRLAAQIMRAGIKAGSYVAVGSGVVDDLAKLAAARQGKPYAVFATAPSMNGYASAAASIMVGCLRTSLAAIPPLGVFCDLEVLAAAPKRLIVAGLGASICRSTAQADWLLSHRLHGTPYSRAPYALLAEPEAWMHGDATAVERLMRGLVLSGLGMALCRSSAPASQGEHLISHYLDCLPPSGWRPALQGEQIAVATLVMARLQESLLDGPPPVIMPDAASEAALKQHFGEKLGGACWQELEPKLAEPEKADTLNAKLAAIWPLLVEELAAIMRPANEIADILKRAGAPASYRDLDLDRHYFATAIWHARAVGNRYTFLDLAAAARRLVPERLIDR